MQKSALYLHLQKISYYLIMQQITSRRLKTESSPQNPWRLLDSQTTELMCPPPPQLVLSCVNAGRHKTGKRGRRAEEEGKDSGVEVGVCLEVESREEVCEAFLMLVQELFTLQSACDIRVQTL